MELRTGTELEMKRQAMKDSYESILMDYAFGTLDQIQTLIVDCHLALSPQAREKVGLCENLGGWLMERDSMPVEMSEQSLGNVLERISGQESYKEEKPETVRPAVQAGFDMPRPLEEAICSFDNKFAWNGVFKGIENFDLPLECKTSKASLLKCDPAVKMPAHKHGGMEMALILRGSYSDEFGSYERGELVIMEENTTHSPVACPEKGCIYMVVLTAPIKMIGWRGIFNPFLRF